MSFNLFPKFQMRHEGFSFYGLRESDEGADTDLIYNFCWPNHGHESRNVIAFQSGTLCIIIK